MLQKFFHRKRIAVLETEEFTLLLERFVDGQVAPMEGDPSVRVRFPNLAGGPHVIKMPVRVEQVLQTQRAPIGEPRLRHPLEDFFGLIARVHQGGFCGLRADQQVAIALECADCFSKVERPDGETG
jgi:hypothetical protein